MDSHAFVAMPFGTKKGFAGEDIDFDAIYRDLIRPALEDAGFVVFRADEEQRPGDIRADMFQELLIADLVVADLTIDNPNVWYELGVRHALRKRGALLIGAERPKAVFDVVADRKLMYRLNDGKPDPAHLEADRTKLSAMAGAALRAWHERPVSPVYGLLSDLQEPEWKSFVITDSKTKEFWDAHQKWQRQLEVARRRSKPGDVMVLAEEGGARIYRTEALRAAGKALTSAGQFAFALEQVEKALEIKPDDLDSCRQKGLLLGRLGQHDAAVEWFDQLVKDHPRDAETHALYGRLLKDRWTADWRTAGRSAEQMRNDARDADAWLRKSIESYLNGFRVDPTHYYSGINIVTLAKLLEHVSGSALEGVDLDAISGAVKWGATNAVQRDGYWALATLGDQEVMIGTVQTIERRYKDAIAAGDKDWFALNSTREQLRLLRDLDYQPKEVGAAIALLDRALASLEAPIKAWQAQRVILFSGHMIDAKGRATPRFPAAKQPIAAREINAVLDQLDVSGNDLGISSGACGGDLLFAEAMLARGAKLEMRIPFAEGEFLVESVDFEKSDTTVPDDWRDRYFKVKANPATTVLVMPEQLGPAGARNAFERVNVWQLYSALCQGPNKVHAVLLWNRKGGDGPGGTQHMHDEVNSRTGQVHVIDTTKLW